MKVEIVMYMLSYYCCHMTDVTNSTLDAAENNGNLVSKKVKKLIQHVMSPTPGVMVSRLKAPLKDQSKSCSTFKVGYLHSKYHYFDFFWLI